MMQLITGLLALTTLGAALGHATDWPQWRGPDRSGHVPAGVHVPDTLPPEPKTLWRVKLGDGHASPVVAAGKVFYLDQQGDREIVYAADARTGKELWRRDLFEAHADAQGRGPRATPVVDGNRLYAQSTKGELRCLDAATGEVIWRRNFVEDFDAIFIGEKSHALAVGASRHGYTGSPLVDGDNLIVLAGGTNGASVVCLNKKTGQPVWKSQNDQAGYAPPVIATVAGVRQIIAFMAEALIGLDVKDGKLLWRVPVKTAYARHVTTPVVVDDIVIVASHEWGLLGTKISNQGGELEATRAWINKAAAMNFASPVVVGHHVFGLGPQRNLVCVDGRSGKIAWSQTGYIQSAASQAHASFLVLGKNILALTDRGELVLFAADTTGFREISRVQACGVNWCNPAFADGNLFLRDHRELLCVRIAK